MEKAPLEAVTFAIQFDNRQSLLLLLDAASWPPLFSVIAAAPRCCDNLHGGSCRSQDMGTCANGVIGLASQEENPKIVGRTSSPFRSSPRWHFR